MGRKSNKISFKNAKIIEDNGTFIIKVKLNDEKEITENLNERLEEFINVEGINIDVKKAGKPFAKRKPTYKYECPKCKKQVTSKEEDLHISCVDCELEYEKVEK